MWIYSFLLFKLAVTNAAIIFPASPCPQIFSYEDDSLAGDRWYGEISIIPATKVTGFSLKITLDRPSNLLVTWNYEITSIDNRVYSVYDPKPKISAGSEMKFKIMVKFDTSRQTPFLSTLHFNGRRICPPDDNPVTLQAATESGFGHTPQRPDLEFTEATDVLDVKQRPTTRPPNQRGNNSYPCGLVENNATPLITHGTSTLRGQWPWHAALYKTEGANLKYECGATLVSKNKVITAAHCVTSPTTGNPGNPINPNQVLLYFGKHKLHQYVEDEGVQTKQVTKITVHSGYNIENYYGDLAILTLNSNVNYTNYVRPICLWESVPDTSDIEGRVGTVVGWGLDENGQTVEDLKAAKLPVVSTVSCLRSYPKFYSQYTSNATYCAGYLNGTTSPCNGDSGGGMVFSRNGIWYLRGIVSLSVAREGLNFCDPRYYVIFTDLAKYADFILRNLT